LLSNNINGAQHINIKAIYKNHAAVYDVRVQKHNTITTGIEKYGELANKLFSWALVCQMSFPCLCL